MHHFENPYENLYSVTDIHLFFGRRQLLNTIIRKVVISTRPPSLQIVGLSRSGKTSLLNILSCLHTTSLKNLVEILEPEVDITPLSKFLFLQIDFSGLLTTSIPAFWKYLAECLARAYEPHQAYTFIEEIKNIQELEDFTKVIKEMISHLLSTTTYNKQYLRIVLLFDEFDHIMTKLPDVLPHLRFLLEHHQGQLIYITATRKELSKYYEHIHNSSISPLFNYFDKPLYLGLLEQDEKTKKQSFQAFITTLSTDSGVSFTKDEVDAITSLGGGHPSLTRLLCLYLFETRKKYPKGRPSDYSKIQEKVYLDIERSLKSIYVNELTDDQQKALLFLGTYSELHEVSHKTWIELHALGLVIPTSSEDSLYKLFSPILEQFLQSYSSSNTQVHVKLWPQRRALQIGQKIEVLTPNEWKIFYFLYTHAGQVCKRETLLQLLGDGSSDVSLPALEITISRLRQKLEEEIERPGFITTVRGQGYRLDIQALEKAVIPQKRAFDQEKIPLLIDDNTNNEETNSQKLQKIEDSISSIENILENLKQTISLLNRDHRTTRPTNKDAPIGP